MDIFAVRLNADLREGRPYSTYPSKAKYAEIHSQAVGDGFHEATNFLEEQGKVRGYLPPKHSSEIRASKNFTLITMTYKGDKNDPDKVFGIQTNCSYVGETKRKNQFIDDLNFHYTCDASDSILFPNGVPNAFESIIGKDHKDWLRGPTKRVEVSKFLHFLSETENEEFSDDIKRKLLEIRNSIDEELFDDRVEEAIANELTYITGNLKPKSRIVSVVQYERDPKVVAFALNRANGKCEHCKRDAPFIRKSTGTPYLEVHHIQTLANGGADITENTIALCPNCHRKRHFG